MAEISESVKFINEAPFYKKIMFKINKILLLSNILNHKLKSTFINFCY